MRGAGQSHREKLQPSLLPITLPSHPPASNNPRHTHKHTRARTSPPIHRHLWVEGRRLCTDQRRSVRLDLRITMLLALPIKRASPPSDKPIHAPSPLPLPRLLPLLSPVPLPPARSSTGLRQAGRRASSEYRRQSSDPLSAPPRTHLCILGHPLYSCPHHRDAPMSPCCAAIISARHSVAHKMYADL